MEQKQLKDIPMLDFWGAEKSSYRPPTIITIGGFAFASEWKLEDIIPSLARWSATETISLERKLEIILSLDHIRKHL